MVWWGKSVRKRERREGPDRLLRKDRSFRSQSTAMLMITTNDDTVTLSSSTY